LTLRGQSRVVVRANIGLFGYYAGPKPHIIDAYGLSDPLLARLPALQPWRVGHFERAIPDGYERSLAAGANRVADAQVAALYDQVKLVTQGRIWSRQRWRAIRRMNLGW
jgi:arabinofuranosyltransferase